MHEMSWLRLGHIAWTIILIVGGFAVFAITTVAAFDWASQRGIIGYFLGLCSIATLVSILWDHIWKQIDRLRKAVYGDSP